MTKSGSLIVGFDDDEGDSDDSESLVSTLSLRGLKERLKKRVDSSRNLFGGSTNIEADSNTQDKDQDSTLTELSTHLSGYSNKSGPSLPKQYKSRSSSNEIERIFGSRLSIHGFSDEDDDDDDYVKNFIPKSPKVQQILMKSIESNILFREWQKNELLEFIDAFEESIWEKGSKILKEGEKGDLFFVMEKGSVEIWKGMKKFVDQSTVGLHFGETALLFNTLRNATIIAKERCFLWSLNREDYEGISRILKRRKTENLAEKLRDIRIGKYYIKDILNYDEITKFSRAAKSAKFKKGQIISERKSCKEIYIVGSGIVDVYTHSKGSLPVDASKSVDFFGDVKNDSNDKKNGDNGSKSTSIASTEDEIYVASTDVECYIISHNDYYSIIGDRDLASLTPSFDNIESDKFSSNGQDIMFGKAATFSKRRSRRQSFAIGKQNKHHETLLKFSSESSLLEDDNEDSESNAKTEGMKSSQKPLRNTHLRNVNSLPASISGENLTGREESAIRRLSELKRAVMPTESIDVGLIQQLLKLGMVADRRLSMKDRSATFSGFHILSVDVKKMSSKPLFDQTAHTKKSSKDSSSSDDNNIIIQRGDKISDPFITSSISTIDEYHSSAEDKDSSLDSEMLSAFCFPNGVSMYLVHNNALEGPKAKSLVGKSADQYQVHAFTNGLGIRKYGVAIITRELIDCHKTISNLRQFRRLNNAAFVISRFWKRHLKEKKDQQLSQQTSSYSSFPSSLEKESHGRLYETKLAFQGRSSSHRHIMDGDKPKKKVVTIAPMNLEITTIPEVTDGSDNSIQNHSNITGAVLRMAKEAFNDMNESFGDYSESCFVEKCYVMTGIELNDMAVHFSALQQLIDQNREEESIRTRFRRSTNNNFRKLSRSHGPHDTRFDEDCEENFSSSSIGELSKILPTIEEKLKGIIFESKISEKNDKDYNKRTSKNGQSQIEVNIGRFSKHYLPLPLPDIPSEWGVVCLCKAIQLPTLMHVLKLLLLERSLLIIGTSSEEVASSACSLLHLLKPFEWESVFIPLLPDSMLDILGSPVPFIVGAVARSDESLVELENNPIVRTALKEGLSIINLDYKKFVPTTEQSIHSTILNCHNPMVSELVFYQSKLNRLVSRENSSLNSFSLFIQHGVTTEEGKLIEKIRASIEKHFLTLSGSAAATQVDGFLQYGQFRRSDTSGEFEFELFLDKFLEPFRAQLVFQEKLAGTQLFHSYVEEKTERLLMFSKSNRNARFIADWCTFRWLLVLRRRTNSDPEKLNGRNNYLHKNQNSIASGYLNGSR